MTKIDAYEDLKLILNDVRSKERSIHMKQAIDTLLEICDDEIKWWSEQKKQKFKKDKK